MRKSIRTILSESALQLNNSDTPFLDASLMLSHVMGSSREKILASYPDSLPEEFLGTFWTMVKKRAAGFPLAYLTGEKEFYGRQFRVKEGILCPRPDTEILVEEALGAIAEYTFKRIHDLGTGSGCIALTLALELPFANVSASDISDIAQEVFTANRKNLKAEGVQFYKTSLVARLPDKLDMIVSNPPYLSTKETRQRLEENWKEPSLALDGGMDGLDLIRIICRDAPEKLKSGGMLVMEAAPEQMNKIEDLLDKNSFVHINRTRDLAGDERVIKGIKP